MKITEKQIQAIVNKEHIKWTEEINTIRQNYKNSKSFIKAVDRYISTLTKLPDDIQEYLNKNSSKINKMYIENHLINLFEINFPIFNSGVLYNNIQIWSINAKNLGQLEECINTEMEIKKKKLKSIKIN